MKRFIIIVTSLLLLTHCADNIKEPETLYDESKMAVVITEIYIYQQSHYIKEYAEMNTSVAEVEAQIIESHGMSVDDFKKNYKYYSLNPDKFRSIMKTVTENLESKLSQSEMQRRIDQKSKPKKNKS